MRENPALGRDAGAGEKSGPQISQREYRASIKRGGSQPDWGVVMASVSGHFGVSGRRSSAMGVSGTAGLPGRSRILAGSRGSETLHAHTWPGEGSWSPVDAAVQHFGESVTPPASAVQQHNGLVIRIANNAAVRVWKKFKGYAGFLRGP